MSKRTYEAGSYLIDIDGHIGKVIADKGRTVIYEAEGQEYEYTKKNVFPYTKRPTRKTYVATWDGGIDIAYTRKELRVQLRDLGASEAEIQVVFITK